MLAQRLRRWAGIIPALVERLVFEDPRRRPVRTERLLESVSGSDDVITTPGL